jgi:4'-phosphopantetheinyl transferase
MERGSAARRPRRGLRSGKLKGNRVTEPEAWAQPPSAWPLGLDEVHVWLAAPDELEDFAGDLATILSPDERERADRHRASTGRARFVVERAILRLLLSSYLGPLPGVPRLAYGAHGKPALAAGASDGTLKFNLSHSHDRALYAFARAREIGVDVEQVRDLPDAERIAARFFSPREQAALRAIPRIERTEAFFRCWTRKEAYVKAVGGGISLSLSSFDVSVAPDEPARLLAVAGQPDATERWTLRDLPPLAGYASALAVEGRGWDLRCWRWSETTLRRALGALPWL